MAHLLAFLITLRTLLHGLGLGMLLLASSLTFSADRLAQPLEVTAAYLELHTGPGQGFPVFHIIERYETLTIDERRTDWFRATTANGVEGWAHYDDLILTLDANGNPVELPAPTLESFIKRRFELGMMMGDFAGADVITLHAGYVFTPNLSLELNLSQALGRFSDSELFHVNVMHQWRPEKRISPFVTLGAGMVRTDPNATLVATIDRTDELLVVGTGLRGYLTRRFYWRAQYQHFLALTERDNTEDVDEWKAGFSFFF